MKALWEELVSPYSSILGKLVSFFILVVISICIAALVAITIGSYDGLFLAPAASTTVVVEDKQVKTGSSRLIYINQLPVYQKDPDRFFLIFKIEAKEASIKVNKEVYEGIHVGDMVRVSYGYGRLSGDPIPIDLLK